MKFELSNFDFDIGIKIWFVHIRYLNLALLSYYY